MARFHTQKKNKKTKETNLFFFTHSLAINDLKSNFEPNKSILIYDFINEYFKNAKSKTNK
jgi:hypothetical protein